MYNNRKGDLLQKKIFITNKTKNTRNSIINTGIKIIIVNRGNKQIINVKRITQYS